MGNLRRWGYRIGPVLVGIGGLALYALAALPYSTSWISASSASQALARPETSFDLGPLHWETQAWGNDRRLEPFRTAFGQECGGLKGLKAGECISRSLSSRVPVGRPTREFVQPVFDPIEHLRAHLGGAPGHCLTRSAILAAALIASGTPARIVQLIPPRLKGHTVVEMWDEHLGWVLMDPLYGGLYGDSRGPAPAVALQEAPKSVRWIGFAGVKGALAEGAGPTVAQSQEMFEGSLVYPDPWLYLRLGENSAPWPFRGRFVRIGPADPWLGTAQPILLVVGLLSVTAGCGTFAWAGLVALRKSYGPSRETPRRLSLGVQISEATER